ncbi:hypothetical protein ACSBR2_041758 [Camellia fascicularis]
MSKIPKHILEKFDSGLLRCGKSCRLQWINYLRPALKRGNFTEQEDEFIIKLHSLLGNKYTISLSPSISFLITFHQLLFRI